MSINEFESWFDQVQEALVELASRQFDHPLGTNELRKASLRHAHVPGELQPLYAVCDGLSLPDVHIGYFIDSVQRVTSASARGEPTRVEARQSIPILVFGSDGGGGRVVLGSADGAVYYLPSAGAVKSGIYIEDEVATVRRVAGSVIGYLWRLKSDIDAFISGREGHHYLDRESGWSMTTELRSEQSRLSPDWTQICELRRGPLALRAGHNRLRWAGEASAHSGNAVITTSGHYPPLIRLKVFCLL